MKEFTELNGFFVVFTDDNKAAVSLTADCSGEIFVPLEINAIPIKTLRISSMDVLSGITRINIPANIEYFSCRKTSDFRYIFDHNIEIEIDPKNPNYFSDGKAVYTKDLSELICFFAHGDEEYRVLDGCKSVLERAFFQSRNLKTVIFPDGLTSIGKNVFAGCKKLNKIFLPSTLKRLEPCAFW